jgi:hypothetical protein
MKAAELAAGKQKLWRCPWCTWPRRAGSIAERWDHCIDSHIDELKKAPAPTLALIVSP